MMAVFLIIILILHGFIHLFGFLKAFNLANFEELKMPISKLWGIVWLLAFLLFAITAIFKIIDNSLWHQTTITAIVISQLLLFKFWNDAKYGTIFNLIIVLILIYLN